MAPFSFPRVTTSALILLMVLGCAGGGSSSAPTPAATPAPAPAATPAPAAAPAPAPTAAPATTTSSARPLYYDRLVTSADLDGRTLRELSLMRNTIFARAGNPFVKPWLDTYFRAQPWYKPLPKQDLSVLTAVDRQNVTTISDKENSFGRADLIAMRDGVKARGGSAPEDVIELSLLSEALGEWSGAADTPMSARNPLEDPTVLDSQLTAGQIAQMSRRDLRLLRNTVYARRGRPFKSMLLKFYFEDKAWYEELPDYTDAALTDVDKRNIQLVQSMEDRLGGPLSEWEHERDEGWFQGA